MKKEPIEIRPKNVHVELPKIIFRNNNDRHKDKQKKPIPKTD